MPGRLFLVIEPRAHVSQQAFEKSVSLAELHGLKVIKQSWTIFGREVLLERPGQGAFVCPPE